METCTEEFARLTARLQGLRCDASPFVTISNPFGLQNWTLPVIEALMVLGAIAALFHAFRWYRRTGDASNLVIWWGGIIALLLIEPVAYFPQWFGLEDSLGLTFVHNQFTVQFFYDRLPLYIVAMYPIFAYLAYVLVQRAGVFTKYRPVVGATCVAFVFLCFFEVIDTVAPQWLWWAWNTELSTSTPALGVVPYLNIQAFALALPFGLALATQWLCRRLRTGRSIAVAVLIVSVLVWPLQFLASAPATLVDLLGGSLVTARAYSLWAYITIAGATTVWAFIGVHRARRAGTAATEEAGRCDYFALGYAVIYLIAGASFWAAGLPAYLAAEGGVTADGAPVGSLPVAILAFMLAAALTAWSYAITKPSRVALPSVAEQHSEREPNRPGRP